MAYKLFIGDKTAGAQIVSLDLAKKNSKIEFDDENDLLQVFVDSATDEIENYIGQPVIQRDNSRFEIEEWPEDFQPAERIASVSGVSYLDDEGNQVDLTADEDFEFFKNDNLLKIKIDKPKDFESPLTVKCALGWSNAEMPASFVSAALLIFSNMDTYREDMPIKLNTSAKGKLRPYKIY